MYLAAAGALVQQLRLDMLGNNIANINTVGHKGEKSIFRLPEENLARETAPAFHHTQPLSPYAPPFDTVIDFSQGVLRQTGNSLDVAIDGDGFFSVRTPEGVLYTRQGSLTLNEEGVLVTRDGYPVQGEGGEITLEEGVVEIDEKGRVYVDGDEAGRLQITAFNDPNRLTKAGHGRFAAADAAVRENQPEATTVRQGFLETSNVSPVRAMTEMIETSRAFEAYQKVIHSVDEATAKSINEVGKTI
jgi:flagellar basal-body rod protein FlgG